MQHLLKDSPLSALCNISVSFFRTEDFVLSAFLETQQAVCACFVLFFASLNSRVKKKKQNWSGIDCF